MSRVVQGQANDDTAQREFKQRRRPASTQKKSSDPKVKLKLTLIGGQAVAGVVVRQDVDAEALAQELAPRVDVAQILGVGVGVQEGDAAPVVVLSGPGRGGILPGRDVPFPDASPVVVLSGPGRGGILPGDVPFPDPSGGRRRGWRTAPPAAQIVRTSGVGVDGARLGIPGRLDVEGRYSGSARRVEPDDLGLLELRRRRGLEQERADGVSHDWILQDIGLLDRRAHTICAAVGIPLTDYTVHFRSPALCVVRDTR